MIWKELEDPALISLSGQIFSHFLHFDSEANIFPVEDYNFDLLLSPGLQLGLSELQGPGTQKIGKT